MAASDFVDQCCQSLIWSLPKNDSSLEHRKKHVAVRTCRRELLKFSEIFCNVLVTRSQESRSIPDIERVFKHARYADAAQEVLVGEDETGKVVAYAPVLKNISWG